jgi:hypothetical protein
MNRPARRAPAPSFPATAATLEQREEQALDEALRQSLPASDPVAVDAPLTPRPGAVADRRA